MSGADRRKAPWRRRSTRVPTVLQLEEVECGAACLGMILAYHRRWVPLEELRHACGVSRDGSKALNVLAAARRYGLEGAGYSHDLDQLDSVKLPFIAYWGFNHFVVVEALLPRGARLNDPVMGRRQVTLEEFDQQFTGVLLSLEPGAEFKRSGRPSSLIRALRSRLSGDGKALAFIAAASLALAVPGLVMPTFTRVFVDDYLVESRHDWLRPMLLAYAIAIVVNSTLIWVQQRYLLRLETKLSLSAGGGFVWHLLHLPIEFFVQRFAGDISSRIDANGRVASLLSGELATNAVGLLTACLYAGFMIGYSPLLAGIVIALVSIDLIMLRVVWRSRADANRLMLQSQGRLLSTSIDGLVNIETIKASGGESDFFERWIDQQARFVDTQQTLGRSSQLLATLPTMVAATTQAVVLGLGSLEVIHGALTMGELLAFQMLVGSFMAPVKRLTELGGRLQQVSADLARLDDVLQTRPAPGLMDDQEAGAPVEPGDATLRQSKLHGAIEVRGLTFGYSRLEPPLLTDVSLSIPPGGRVAIVGSSGSGKSTLAKLIAGLHRPWSGEILFDGVPAETLPRPLLANSLAMVDQDIALFAGSIGDNLSLWDELLDANVVVKAAMDACIHNEIQARPIAYGGPISEGGRNFSGGEMQRLEIARALAVEPSILVLDEATASLDAVTERQVGAYVQRRGCTCVIVAHRLSTIRDCDEIIVIEAGRIVERGRHETLLQQNGPYAELIRAH